MKTPFELAKEAYPEWIEVGKSWWRLVDGGSVSGMSEHRGKLILQEDREGCSSVFNHWGSYIMESEFEAQPQGEVGPTEKMVCDHCGGDECGFDSDGFDHFYNSDLHICQCCMDQLHDAVQDDCPFCESDKTYLLDEKSFIFQCPDCGKQSQVEDGKLIGRSEPIKPL